MAFYDTADAVYGVGTYGSASYGRVTPIIQVTGVSATANTRTIHLNVFEVDVTEPIYNAPSATGSVGSLTLNTTAGLLGVTATGTANSVGVGVSKTLDSVSASANSNSVTVNLAEKPEGALATLTLDTTGLLVKSVNRVQVLGFELTGSIGTLEPQTLEALQSVEATVSIGTVKANPTEKLNSVNATGSVGSLTLHTTAAIFGVEGTGQVGSVGGAPTEEINSVEATGNIGTVVVHVSERMVSTNLTGTMGSVTTTAVVFDFEAVKDQYSRRRTVLLPRVA